MFDAKEWGTRQLTEPAGWDDIEWVDEWDEVRKSVEGVGEETVGFGDPGDPILFAFVDGELKAAFYVSTRGAYQAEVFDGTQAWYSATWAPEWAPMAEPVVVKRAWDEVN